jgi:hypothetical protein
MATVRDGAHERNRTFDLFLTKEVLYRLSYVSELSIMACFELHSMERETGIEPAPLAWKAKVLPLNYSRTGNYTCHKTNLVVEGGGFEPPKS